MFSTVGDLGKASTTLKDNIEIDIKAPVSLSFATKHLLAFTKATPLNTSVKLSLKENNPLALEYAIGDRGYIKYYLAPKLEI